MLVMGANPRLSLTTAYCNSKRHSRAGAQDNNSLSRGAGRKDNDADRVGL